MTDDNLFDHFRSKLSALRPSEAEMANDWAALEAQLNAVVPQEKKRRPLLLPFLLFAGLVLSNGLWWAVHHSALNNVQQVENQVNTLQKIIDSIEHKQVIHRTDTIWRTIYIKENMTGFNRNTSDFKENRPLSILEEKQENSNLTTKIAGVFNAKHPNRPFRILEEKKEKDSPKTEVTEVTSSKVERLREEKEAIEVTPKMVENTQQVVLPIAKLPIELKILTLETPMQAPFLDNKPIVITEKTKPLFFRHPSVKIGLKGDYLTPRSAGLMAQNGIGMGVQTSIGFTKHLSVVGAIGMARLNYTATDKDAVLGTSEALTAAVNQPNSTVQMHINNQGCMHYDLSLHYTFSPIVKLMPFVSMGFGGMTLRPFQMDMQVMNNQTMMVQQSNFQVNPTIHRQLMSHLSAGFEIPISRHFSMSFEGYYMRYWLKTVALSPDFMGVRTGFYYGF